MRPLIVTAFFADADFAWLDGLRRAHFPPARNVVPAHLTLFHHLPPSLADELRRRLAEEARGPAPVASLVGPLRLDRGVALRVRSEGLEAIRARLADAFAGLLTRQDQAGWRPHVTLQNKAEPAAVRALRSELGRLAWPRPLAIAGLAIWAYRDGPWELVRRFPFSRSGRFPRS